VLSGSTIVLPLQTGAIAAHRLSDGAPMWTSELAPERPLAADAEHVYVPSGEAIHALQAETGRVAWRVPLGGPSTAPPLAHAGWVIAAAAGEVIAIRAADGETIWRQKTGPVEFRPAVDGELLFVSVVEGHLLALDVRDGSGRWKEPLGSAPGEPFAVGGRVYLGTQDKRFYVLHAESGRIESSRRIGGETRGRTAVDDDHAYFASMDNVVWAVDRADGAIEWKHGLVYRATAGPIRVGAVVLVPGQNVDVLPVFDARTGTPAGTVTFPALLGAVPLLVERPEEPPALVAVAGAHEKPWVLVMLETSLVPAIPIQPVTVIPGEAVALPLPPPGG
jgi:outer membrane protein assembly factor BamB